MPRIPLEDEYLDILSKAQRGLGFSDEELIAKSGVSAGELEHVRGGDPAAPALPALASALGLGPVSLVVAAHKSWYPEAVEVEGLAQFNTTFEDMTVNAYLCWDPVSRDAVVFDTGADASGLLAFANENGLHIRLILLTHTHPDHIADLARLISRTAAPVWVNEHEAIPGAETFTEGKTFMVGGLKIGSRLTCGHSVGGITFVVDGLSTPLAIVGDAIFAGSMGGGKISYPDALRTNQSEIFSLPDETILASGHGPLTTLAEQKQHNPFFAL